MPISSTDIHLRYSIGSAGYTQQTSPNASLGGWMSSTDVTPSGLDNLFDDIPGINNANAVVDYRCIFVHNMHATLTYQNVIAYIPSTTAGGAQVNIGVDTTGPGGTPGPFAYNSTPQQAAIIATTQTAPSGVIFPPAAPTSRNDANVVSLGNIPAGYCRALWLKRAAINSTALNNDGITLRIEGDTRQ